MEWLLAPVVLAAIIAAAVKIWQTFYHARHRATTEQPSAHANVTVNLGGVLEDPRREPGPGHVQTIPVRPSEVRDVPSPVTPVSTVDPLDFSPVASSTRYEDLSDPAQRQEALMRDLYRASRGGLRAEIPDITADGMRSQ